ncbi:MAG: hypothetical protein L0Z70_13050 [Chloroflexi bacterium]|nr:hypothetical protein [Chloroflexota bacterium]
MNDEQIEKALYAWPLAETPPGFRQSVLDRLKPRRAGIPVKFRLTWMDYALGAFFALLPLLGYLAYVTLPPRSLLYLKYQWMLLQSPAYAPLVAAAAVCAALIAAALVIQSALQIYTLPDASF